MRSGREDTIAEMQPAKIATASFGGGGGLSLTQFGPHGNAGRRIRRGGLMGRHGTWDDRHDTNSSYSHQLFFGGGSTFMWAAALVIFNNHQFKLPCTIIVVPESASLESCTLPHPSMCMPSSESDRQFSCTQRCGDVNTSPKLWPSSLGCLPARLVELAHHTQIPGASHHQLRWARQQSSRPIQERSRTRECLT